MVSVLHEIISSSRISSIPLPVGCDEEGEPAGGGPPLAAQSGEDDGPISTRWSGCRKKGGVWRTGSARRLPPCPAATVGGCSWWMEPPCKRRTPPNTLDWRQGQYLGKNDRLVTMSTPDEASCDMLLLCALDQLPRRPGRHQPRAAKIRLPENAWHRRTNPYGSLVSKSSLRSGFRQ